MRKKLLTLLLIVLAFTTTGLGCKNSGAASRFPAVALEYWGVFEEPAAINLLTLPYTGRHPKVSINYRKFREDEYKQKMLEAWALGQGPDLFMIPVTKIREYEKFITPMPATMTAPVEYEKGSIKKETVTELKTYSGYTTKQLRDLFLDTVSQDVIINNQIYGLPYSIDTLSVYYNREILKNNNIPLPAANWQELITQAARISKLDTQGNLVESTIALGTTNNIPNVGDILSAIMMQIGIEMSNGSSVSFGSNPETLNAIQFYLSFAREGLQNYSWNETLGNALDVFTAGKLAYFIGYPYHAAQIRAANPKLDWDVIPLFKPENADIVPTYANYWVTVVTKPISNSVDDKLKAELAWQYLLESTEAKNVSPYLNNPASPKTTVLKSLVASQQQSPVLGPYAQYLLNAKTWYRGYNYDLAEKYFLEMIDNVKDAVANNLPPEPLIGANAARIQQTYTPTL